MSWKLAEDPIARYKTLAAASVPAVPVELTPGVLERHIRDGNGDSTDHLAEHLSRHSLLTLAEAKTVVGDAVNVRDSPELQAAAVSQAVATATAGSADIELTDPVMLNPWLRVVFAALLCFAVGGCIFCIDQIGDKSNVPESSLIGLAVIGVLGIIGILVLVMGYKSVKITGAPPGG